MKSLNFCSKDEFNAFLKSKEGLAVILRRNCFSPEEINWDENKIEESFNSFIKKFNDLKNNGCALSNHFVLSKEEEFEYFALMHFLRSSCLKGAVFNTNDLGKEFVTIEDEKDIKKLEMIFSIRSGLISVNTPLVDNFCSKLVCPKAIVSDAKSECMFSLIKSVEMFDPFKSNRFSTYAFSSFRNTFNDFITKKNRQHKLMHAYSRSKNVKDFEYNESFDYSDSISFISEIINITKSNPESLGLNDIEVKCIMYIIDDDGRNLDEKACELGVSRGTLKNRTISALNKIKEKITGIIFK